MLVFQLISITLLLISAALMFGPQIIIYGSRGACALAKDDQAQMVAGGLTVAFLFVLLAPHVGYSVSIGAATATIA